MDLGNRPSRGFAAESHDDFSVDRLASIDRPTIDQRVVELQDFVRVP